MHHHSGSMQPKKKKKATNPIELFISFASTIDMVQPTGAKYGSEHGSGAAPEACVHQDVRLSPTDRVVAAGREPWHRASIATGGQAPQV